ncbi:hypothetical protein [Vibrio vulnificus]|uniref:hypothetical protein n=1 Tax=Vibrio vulnificus TaxID=672 RepID=UPI0028A495F7|nr:hypothetical protein [Vibrio vulnificus]
MTINKSSNILFLIPFALWCLVPYFSFDLIARFAVLLSLLSFIVIAFYGGFIESNEKKISYYLAIVFVLLVYINFTNFIFSSSEFTLRHLHFSMFLLVSGFCSLYINVSSNKYSKIVVVTILASNIITALITLKGLYLDHNIARLLSKSNDVSVHLAKQGYGGYGYIYANLVIFPILCLFSKLNYDFNRSTTIVGGLVNFNIILCVLLLTKAQYSIALVCLIVVIVYLSYKILGGYVSVLIILILFLIFLVLPVASFISIESIGDILEGTRYKAKFLDVMSAFDGAAKVDGDVTSRATAYIKSVTIFFENPILGSLSFDNNIGRHSDILDKFAQWGGVIGVLVTYLIIALPLKIEKMIPDKYRYFIVCFVFCLLWTAMFNTMPMEAAVAIILLVSIVNIYKKEFINV